MYKQITFSKEKQFETNFGTKSENLSFISEKMVGMVIGIAVYFHEHPESISIIDRSHKMYLKTKKQLLFVNRHRIFPANRGKTFFEV